MSSKTKDKIRTSDIPRAAAGRTELSPWIPWSDLPALKPGEAIEIEVEKKRPFEAFENRIRSNKTLKRRFPHLKVTVRGQRIWIAYPNAEMPKKWA